MKKQFVMIGIFALSLAGGIAWADPIDQGPNGEATSVGSQGTDYNTDDPNVAMYTQGVPDDYLVWCEKCGKFVPASAMRLANNTAARPSVVSRRGKGGDGALQKNDTGQQ